MNVFEHVYCVTNITFVEIFTASYSIVKNTLFIVLSCVDFYYNLVDFVIKRVKHSYLCRCHIERRLHLKASNKNYIKYKKVYVLYSCKRLWLFLSTLFSVSFTPRWIWVNGNDNNESCHHNCNNVSREINTTAWYYRHLWSITPSLLKSSFRKTIDMKTNKLGYTLRLENINNIDDVFCFVSTQADYVTCSFLFIH